VACFFGRGFGGIISNQITLCFLEGLAIKVGSLGDAVAFTTLPSSDVNMDDYDLQITRQYGFALITHHYVPLLPNTRQCMLLLAILRHRVSPAARGSC
jgi:hypothetical protein